LRNTALNLHRLDGHANIARAQRRTACRAGVTNTRTQGVGKVVTKGPDLGGCCWGDDAVG